MSNLSENPKVWTTKEGQHIPISQMTDRHLKNTIRMLKRTASARRENAIAILSAGTMQVSGDMALEALESELNMAESMDDEEFLEWSVPQYDELLKESERRGLEV